MAFLAPLIGAALGLGTVGTALVSVGLGVGLSFLSNKLKPKTKSAPSGSRVGLTIDTNAPRQVIIGETATGGSLVFWHLSGSDNKKLWMVIALADHECTSLQSVIVSNKLKSWNSGSGQVDGYGSDLLVRFYSGAPGQTADSALVSASGGRWTSSEVGTGVCYVVVEATYDEKKFPEGIPEFGFVVRGAKLFDPRTETTAYSDNSAVAVYNLLRGISSNGEPLIGMNVPALAIRQSEAEAAANACDEDVDLKGGGDEKRYRCGVVLDCDMTNRDAIETLLASMAGEVIESGGIYRIMAGVAQSPVANITDDDLIVDEPLTVRPKKGRNEIVNSVQGSFSDPSRNYAPIGLPPRTSSEDEEADGGIRLSTTLDLVAVTSRSQAQRVCEIERRRSRRMGSASMRLRARWFVLEPGDWITFTSNRRGYVSKTFVIESASGARDLQSDIVLAETDEDIDEWSVELEIDDDQVIDQPPAGPAFDTVTGVVLANLTFTALGGEQRPGLQITWTPVDDPTVTSLALQYRKVGDTTALERQILDPLAGSYAWLDGVQGQLEYEARLRPVTLPERAVNWTSWASTAENSPPQVVTQAVEALSVPPDTITPQMLSAQSRLELMISTATSALQGSVNERIEEAIRIATEASSAALGIASENTRLLRQVRAQSGSNTIAITETLEAVGGSEALAARWAVAIDINGNVTGLVQLSGDLNYSQFSVIADNFVFSHPDIDGGTPFPALIISDLGDGPVARLNGDLIVNAILAQEGNFITLSSISLNAGTITAGRLQNADNTTYLDLNTGDFQIG